METTAAATGSQQGSGAGLRWLFSPGLDLLGFGAPAVVSLAACAWLAALGRIDAPLSPMVWLLAVVLVDVAHVYATAYRVYLDPAELLRRRRLYLGLPLVCYVAGLVSYAISPLTFWRALAYLAVIHFVRQQAGWVALSWRRDLGAVPARWRRLDRGLDQAAVYAGTVYPLIWWHAHLPRHFHWFIAGDFADLLPRWLPQGLWPAWAAIGLLWALRQAHRVSAGQGVNAAKLLVMSSTWATWYAGIVVFDSDVAFTLTNVLVHGVPYVLTVWRWRSGRQGADLTPRAGAQQSRAPVFAAAASLLVFYLPLGAAAFLEEGLWDRLVWRDHPLLFGWFWPLPGWQPGEAALLLLTPLLALPQATHYMLDAWIWRSADNPDLGRRLGL